MSYAKTQPQKSKQEDTTMTITRNGRSYIFRECDVRGYTQEEVQTLADRTGRMQYEPNGFVWLVVPGIGYGREDN